MNSNLKRNLIIIPTLALVGLLGAKASFADGKEGHHKKGMHGEHGGKYAEGKKGKQRTKKMMRKMSKTLDLSEAQEEAMLEIMQAQQDSMMQNRQAMQDQLEKLRSLEAGSDAYLALAKEIGAMQGEAMTQRLVQRGETQAQIMALLTPEQVEKYEAMHAEKAEK